VENAAALRDSQLPLNVLIVAEVRLLREALAHVIERDRALSVCGLSSDPNEALATTLDRQPDVVLIDAAFPNGTDVVGRLRNIACRVQVVVVAVQETEQNIIAWAEAGVVGYIPTTASLADVVTLLNDIIAGKQICSEPVAAGMLRRISCTARSDISQNDVPPAPILTRREVQIVELIASGLSNKDISRRLNIGVSTTKSHVHHLLGKLALQRRGQIAQWINHKTRNMALPLVLAGRIIADFL
jgi:DNA-binding NarL/FixJ family response regulator